MKKSPLVCLGSVLVLLFCGTAAGAPQRPVALIYALTGEATLTFSDEGRRPVRLFDRLTVGAVVDVGPGSRLALVFENGRRYELREISRATLGPADLSARSGAVRPLPAVPPLPRLLPIAEEERPGLRAGAVRIRAERIVGLSPDGGAATLADATRLRFEPVDGGGTYRIEVHDRQGNVIHTEETPDTRVSIPTGLLQPGVRYDWTVRTVGRAGPVARGEAGFVTLPAPLGLRVQELIVEGAVSPEKVVVETVAPGSAAERAGLLPGDELAEWSGEGGESGALRTPFDLAYVKVEKAPRGTILLRGFRGAERRSWEVAPGIWGIEARPALEPDLLALYEQGRQLIASGDLDGGTGLWRSMLATLERQATVELASWLEDRLAKAFAAAARWQEADAIWERAARRLEPQRASSAAEILHAWGRTLRQRDAWGRAGVCHRRALRLVPAESLAAARELSALGNLARHQGDFAAAENLLRQARTIREKLAPESLDLAASFGDFGSLAGRRGDAAAAKEHFTKALELRQRLAPGSLEEATTLIDLAVGAQERGDFTSSGERFRRGIALYERLSPNDPELARALSRLGFDEMYRGELALAEDLFRRALAIRQKLEPESPSVAASLRNLGFIAGERGELAAAEEYHRRSLELREKLHPGSAEVAESLANLGGIERRNGNLAEADELYRRALEIEKKLAPESLNFIKMNIDRAIVAVERGDLRLAEELYGRALLLVEERSPGALHMSDILEGLGDVAFQRGDLTKAEDLFRRTVAIREKLAPGSTRLGLALNGLGRVHRRAGRLGTAAEYLCRATEMLDQQRKKLGGTPEARSAFGGTTAEHYGDCVAALIDVGRPDEAFHVLERGRARAFLDLLAERDLRWPADLPAALVRSRKQVDVEYDRTQAALARLSPVRAEAEVNRLLVRLRELRVQQEEMAAKIRQASPRNANLYDPEPLDLAATRAVLDPGTLLVAYSIGRDRSFLFVIDSIGTPGPGLTVFPLSFGDQLLRQRVGSFRNLLQRADSDRDALAAQARELYDLLLRPAESRIAKAARILIAPDGPLHILPFAALVRDGRFLAEQKPVHTVISATVYAELKRARSERPPSPRLELAAFGDPSYPSSGSSSVTHPEVRAMLGRGLELTPLPASRDEVLGIASLYPEARAFLGVEATEERAKAIGKEARYLHFACHGLLDERFPLSSALALAIPGAPEDGQDNGLLQAWEIFESMRLDAELVTLSACDSAMGAEMGGEGLLGLTRAFQYAGARSVLASLWSVSDASTADLMKRFYGHLRAGKTKDEALRAAQAALIRSPEFSHPYHWAAFLLSGDWK